MGDDVVVEAVESGQEVQTGMTDTALEHISTWTGDEPVEDEPQ